MLTKIGSNFNRKTWILMGIAILMDWLLSLSGYLSGVTIVPFVGLFLVAVLCGPWAGALTGLLGTIMTNLFWFLLFPETGSYTLSSFLGWCFFYLLIGYFAGRMSQWGYFRFWWTSILAGFSAAILTITLLLFFDLMTVDMSEFSSMFSINYFILPMTLSALLAFFLVKSPLNQYFVGLPYAGDALAVSSPSVSQKAIGLTVLSVIIFSILFVIWFATEMSAAVN
jgi:hypothetical protein